MVRRSPCFSQDCFVVAFPDVIGFKMELKWHSLKVVGDVCDFFCSLIYLPLACPFSVFPVSLTLALTVVLGVPFDAFSFALCSPAEYASVLYTFSTTSCDSVCTMCVWRCPLTVLSILKLE